MKRFLRRLILFVVGTSVFCAMTLLTTPLAQSSPNFQLAQAQLSTPAQLPPLPYADNALEPYIDTRTMQLHHDKHHAAYVEKLNAALEKYPDLQGKSVETLLSDLDSVPEDIRTTVRNNGGGHLNHTMFWQIMSPNGGEQPTGELAEAINSTFSSFDEFKTAQELRS